MKKILIYLCVSVLVGSGGSDLSVDWKAWKVKNRKRYSSSMEELSKFKIFSQHLEFVNNNNNDVNAEFRLGTNEYSDQVISKRPKLIVKDITDTNNHIIGNLVYAPQSFDWRTKGAITPVQNQGQMGDSLPFVATECMDSYAFIIEGRLVSSSKQEVYDCCTNGQHLSPVFDCIHNIGGLCSTTSYPSTGQPEKCRNSTCQPVIQNHGTTYIKSGDENQLQMAILQSPVMAAIDASHQSFQLYSSSIYDEPKCSSTQIDHLVQIVGYGTEGGNDYWIVKNSWGTSWGMNGYIYMSRNKNNQCGIATAASYPV